MWLYRGETNDGVAKCVCVCWRGGEAQATYDQTFLRFIIFLEKWRAGRKTAFLPSAHLRLDGSIARICKELVMPRPIIGQQQRINHCPFGMYGTIRLVPSRYLCVFVVREDWGLGWGARGVIHRQGWITFYACPWHYLFTCLARAKHSCKVKFLHLRPFYFQPSAKLIFVNANEGEILRIR